MQNNCIQTFIPLDKSSVLFRPQLKRKEQNRDLELGDMQLLCVCACVYTCVNAWMCVYYMLRFWERSSTVFVLCRLIAFVQWALTPLWCNRLSACLFWKVSISHGTTNLNYLTFILFCSFFAISWTVRQWVALLSMTQGTLLLGLHALCKRNGHSH